MMIFGSVRSSRSHNVCLSVCHVDSNLIRALNLNLSNSDFQVVLSDLSQLFLGSGDDMYLVTASKDNTAKIWSLYDYSHVRDLLGHKSPVRPLTNNPKHTPLLSRSPVSK